MANSAASHAQGRADALPSTLRPGSHLSGRRLKTRPLAGGRQCWGASSEEQSSFFLTSPKHTVLWSTWKWEAMTSLTHEETTLICTVNWKKWWTTLRYVNGRVWSTLGHFPPLNLKGFHGKGICFERSFKTSGPRLRVEGIKRGWNVYSELTVWLKLWTPPKQEYTKSQMVLTTVLAAGLASFVSVYSVWVCCFYDFV